MAGNLRLIQNECFYHGGVLASADAEAFAPSDRTLRRVELCEGLTRITFRSMQGLLSSLGSDRIEAWKALRAGGTTRLSGIPECLMEAGIRITSDDLAELIALDLVRVDPTDPGRLTLAASLTVTL